MNDNTTSTSSAGEPVDLLVIGGGINGSGIARDATGRGFKVVLCEMDDLAEHTSSSSTKLIHGGLRYLENYDFLLVRHALAEREVLLRSAPHIIWPLRFVLPHHAELRPRWLIRLGLFLYDRLGGRKLLPSSNSIELRSSEAGEPLKDDFTHGFEYSDCWVQDARLVVLNARDAHARGARILTHTRCTSLQRSTSGWSAELRDQVTGTTETVHARAVVNASGPWVEETLHLEQASASRNAVRLVKGSHIVVRRLFDHDKAYIFQHADGRVVFAIPYEQEFTLIGTTDVEIDDAPGHVEIDDSEVRYLCDVVNEYFRQQIGPADVVWSYAGVRPLFDDASDKPSKVTRDYRLELDDREAPIVSVFGGKITTYRKLSEQVMDMLCDAMGVTASAWTARQPLPGGGFDAADYDWFLTDCGQRYPWLPHAVLRDYTRNYGTEIDTILDGRHSLEDLGDSFGAGLYACEVEYLVEHEWARSATDILWRRSKKGLHLPAGGEQALQAWLESRYHNQHVATSSPGGGDWA